MHKTDCFMYFLGILFRYCQHWNGCSPNMQQSASAYYKFARLGYQAKTGKKQNAINNYHVPVVFVIAVDDESVAVIVKLLEEVPTNAV